MLMQWDQHRFEAQGWTLRWCLWLFSVADVVEFELLFLLGALVPIPMSGLQLTGRRNVKCSRQSINRWKKKVTGKHTYLLPKI